MDINLSWFAKDFLVQGADIRMIVAYDSMSTDQQSTDQGSLAASIATTWTLPLRADLSPALVSVAGSIASSLSNIGLSNGSAQGWTLGSVKTPGDTFQTSGGNQNCGAPASDFYVAAGTSRTAWTTATTTGVIQIWAAGGTHSVRTGNAYCDVYGGNPFSQRQCHARYIVKGTANNTTDTLLKGIRQASNVAITTVSAANTAYVSSAAMALSGTTVQAFDADCGAGAGNAGMHITNPTSPTGATALRMIGLGGRVFRSSAAAPIAGWHLAAWGTGGHTISQFASCLGLTGYTTPDPYFSATDAQAFAAAMVGGGATAGPTHWMIYTGKNFSATEQTELAAGNTTTYRDNHIAVINRCVAISRALNGATTMPKVCLVFSEAHQNGYTATFWRTALDAIQQAAANTGQSCCDLFMRTNTLALTGTPFSSWANPLGKQASINDAVGTSSGPVAATNDYLHHSKTSDRIVAEMIWDAMVQSCGYLPKVSVYGAADGFERIPTRARSYGVR
jgi:hypothetical protein